MCSVNVVADACSKKDATPNIIKPDNKFPTHQRRGVLLNPGGARLCLHGIDVLVLERVVVVRVGRRAARLQLHLHHLLRLRFQLLEVRHVRNVVRAALDALELQQGPRLAWHGRHLERGLDVDLVLRVRLVPEAGDEEEGGGEEQHHQGGAGLPLPQTPVHHDLVQTSQLGGQRLVLRLKCIDLFLKVHNLDNVAESERLFDVLVHSSCPRPIVLLDLQDLVKSLVRYTLFDKV